MLSQHSRVRRPGRWSGPGPGRSRRRRPGRRRSRRRAGKNWLGRLHRFHRLRTCRPGKSRSPRRRGMSRPGRRRTWTRRGGSRRRLGRLNKRSPRRRVGTGPAGIRRRRRGQSRRCLWNRRCRRLRRTGFDSSPEHTERKRRRPWNSVKSLVGTGRNMWNPWRTRRIRGCTGHNWSNLCLGGMFRYNRVDK